MPIRSESSRRGGEEGREAGGQKSEVIGQRSEVRESARAWFILYSSSFPFVPDPKNDLLCVSGWPCKPNANQTQTIVQTNTQTNLVAPAKGLVLRKRSRKSNANQHANHRANQIARHANQIIRDANKLQGREARGERREAVIASRFPTVYRLLATSSVTGYWLLFHE
jgi:hypothetical protein